jgi:hypothetical protein
MVDKKPTAAFWAVAAVVLPVVDVGLACLDVWLIDAANLGLVWFFAVFAAALGVELAGLRWWLRRHGVRLADRWIVLAGLLITLETGFVLVLGLIAIVNAGGD